jgi:lipoate-protein ligase A
MLIFETQFSSPAEQLACDEALLDYCESHESPGLIRFWESSTHFVVLGYGKRLAAEVFEEACEQLNVPVLRRASGGGTVVQGPGALT